VCSGKIRNTRADDISQATAKWDRQGNAVYMATFTAPHDMGMRLRNLLPVIADGFRTVISGRAWVGESPSAYAKRVERWEDNGLHKGRPRPVRSTGIKERLGIVGTIRAMEVTYGAHGWHPHLHVLVYIEGEMNARGLTELTLYLRKRWARFIVKAGYRVPHDTHGVQVQLCESAEEAGKYIAKTQDGRAVGNEIARGDLKQGRKESRTPFEILDDFRWTGDAEDLAIWHEYESATKGHQAITWSKGLRAILGATDEKSDEDIAAEEIGGADLALIPNDLWSAIVKVPGLSSCVLDSAERGGLDAINRLLSHHGLGPALPPEALKYLE
jgi:hypothetical protein